jgi:hypothetical protein
VIMLRCSYAIARKPLDERAVKLNAPVN